MQTHVEVQSVILPNITHARNGTHTPERRHVTLLEALAKRGDAFGGELAYEIPVPIIAQAAELGVVQTARDKP